MEKTKHQMNVVEAFQRGLKPLKVSGVIYYSCEKCGARYKDNSGRIVKGAIIKVENKINANPKTEKSS